MTTEFLPTYIVHIPQHEGYIGLFYSTIAINPLKSLSPSCNTFTNEPLVKSVWVLNFQFRDFWGRNILASIYLVSLIQVRIWGIQNNLKIRHSFRISRLRSSFGNSHGSEIWHGIFWGLNFGPVIFLGFVWSSLDFFGFWVLPPFDQSLSLEIRSTPLGT